MENILAGKQRIAFGGASISGEGGGYGFGDIDEDGSKDLLCYAYEKGIKVFDTAPCYGYHLSEKRIGRALKNVRENVVIISKSGVTWHPNKRLDLNNGPQVTSKMLDDSLKALDSDYIDLYMIHWPDKKIDIRKPMEILAKAKLAGKIKHIGLCNTFVDDIILAKEIDSIDVVQSEFNLLNNKAAKDLFPYLKENKIEFMSYGTFDKGILTGRAHKGRKYNRSDLRSWAPWWKKSNLDEKYEQVEIINLITKKYNHSLLEAALGFNLGHEELGVAICGARSISQIDSILKATENLPDKQIINEITRALE